jgi:5'-nucleotidase
MSVTLGKPDWAHIDTVLLDLDGTLLDLAFDNHFWLEIVPAAYAAARTTSVDVARTELAPRLLPGAEEFLLRLRAAGKRVVLLTNSHPRVLRIKDEKTRVLRYFDAAFTSHDFGVAKETAQFWEAVRAVEPFDPQRSLFADDSAPVLRAAQLAGIRWIYGVCRPDSVQTVREHLDVAAIDSVSELV